MPRSCVRSNARWPGTRQPSGSTGCSEGVPAGPIHDFAQVFADAHTHARRMVEEVEHPVAGRVRTLGFPLKMSDTPLRVRRAPPLLGEHAAEILRELGMETGGDL